MSKKAVGNQSYIFKEPVYIIGEGSVVGQKEGEGPFGQYFDEICMDPMIGGKSWEEGESNLVSKACEHAIINAGVKKEDIDIGVGGDLLGQIIATTFGVSKYDMPFLGLYGACSTMGESLAISSMLIEGGFTDVTLAVTSSHFAGAEKQFRFPLGYGAQRPKAATWTVTGSGAVVLASKEYAEKMKSITERSKENISQKNVCIKGVTIGKIVDYGIMDSMNMGAAMMPAAMDTLINHFKDYDCIPKDYDLIVTGDLGTSGAGMLKEFMAEAGYDISENHFDCGEKLFDSIKQDTHSGGSGCGCSAAMFSGYLIRQLRKGTFKKILFMPTGALLSPVSFREGKSIPGIAHAIIIETE